MTFEGAEHVVAVTAEQTDTAGSDDTDNATEETSTAEDQNDSGTQSSAEGDSASEDATEGSSSSGMTGIENTPSGNPIALFTCTEDTFVIASGGGVVTRITDDELFGTLLTIDHRNGYITIYRNRSEALVRVGDTIERGDQLFEITTDHQSFGYQIKLNDAYINPASMIEIDG